MKTYRSHEGPLNHQNLRFIKGEFRPPRKGEWFLSGAIVGAYLAPNDLSNPYYIAMPHEVVIKKCHHCDGSGKLEFKK